MSLREEGGRVTPPVLEATDREWSERRVLCNVHLRDRPSVCSDLPGGTLWESGQGEGFVQGLRGLRRNGRGEN